MQVILAWYDVQECLELEWLLWRFSAFALSFIVLKRHAE